jgi:hypothetical protein
MKRDPWYYGTWEGARVSMHEQNLRLTLAEKIRILEDMEQLAVRIHCQRHRAGLPVDAKILPLIEAAVAEEQAAYHPKPGAGSSEL